ncbi:MAG: GNAT family N-acetyltransferase [Candidatus Eremiobacteraeota bacterium]|nr:GNAT family N-acetyltransferase [Candidatus Eremiobacteraeota bacterium]MBV8333114.1 GNAT family N-acetyltransferase [Candidatus Eremiobacteraeota bacterium]MBV8423735.1 GNAT family N-acetyltransferase [Candidatus Eremiobacteraeota bacterium]MBV8722279.1 GNAT family N-acetyltransferase [Candidatus Eremiobacteraeota bacterium]
MRTYREDDAEALQALADDWEVARYMRDRFPHPYGIADAREWIAKNAHPLSTNFAIEADGEYAGGVGYMRFENEARLTAEAGYWLGRKFWGRGIATAAFGCLVQLAFEREDVVRLEAGAYSNNPRSQRVLEKCGFQREGVHRRAVIKGDEILDVVMYAKLRD